MFDGLTSVHQDPRHYTTTSGAVPRYQLLSQDTGLAYGYFDRVELQQRTPLAILSAAVHHDQMLQLFTTYHGAVPTTNHSLISSASHRSLQSIQSKTALGHVFLDSLFTFMDPSQSTRLWFNDLPLVQDHFESQQECCRKPLWNLLHSLFPSHAPDIVETTQ